ncbi:MAG: energy transducer TonB [Longimicrobiales bacterium]|nr:energy transducer TonB [Longimicrobiales bacterium]
MPPELAELDAELSSIRYEERPSFAPELEADLAREWQSLQGRRYWPVRQLMAAGLAGLLMVGLGVPSARAALVRAVGSLAVLVGVASAPPEPAPLPPPTVDLPAVLDEGTLEAALPAPTVSSPATPGPLERYTGPEATFPELLDRPWAETLIRRNYPIGFQRAGIGGTVGVLLWVDSTGAVDFVNLGASSGIPELDRAALQVAPSLQFEPARRGGRAVGTWVEFDVRFEPSEESTDEDWLPEVTPMDRPADPDLAPPIPGPEWREGSALLTPATLSAGDFLLSAIGDERVLERLGTVDQVLAGEPPAGRTPTEWRAEVSAVLEEAMARAPDNPAPFLALSRIRQKQGLRTEAQVLLERGLQRAQRNPGAISPRILAELHFDRGVLVKASWLGTRNLGRLRADALSASVCPRARSSGGASSGYASVDRLIAWNYLCPEELGEILSRSFESLEHEGAADRAITLASFRTAVQAYPAHSGANVEVLLGLAEEGRWQDLLAGAQRFLGASGGDPHGHLMAGLALQRLSRSEEAEASFREALQALPPEEAAQVEDVAPLLLEPQASEYRQLSMAQKAEWRRAFWGPLDPILATPVNERAVEHLARTSYAFLRFESIRSDPAEVWVRYGQPDAIRAFDEGPGVRTELWDFGPGPDLTFRRLAASSTPVLTTEGRSYLDEVRQLVPHRYGNASRVVYALPTQVGRFRGADQATSEVEMFTRVPVLLATGQTDSLDVCLVLLGQDRDTLSLTVSRVPAVEGDVSLKATARADVAGMVVEVYSSRIGQAAALRRTVPPLAAASGATMSDLVLTAPASPRVGEVKRGGGWMEPLALDRPIQTHAIGAYVELYGVRPIASWYRLRAELQDRATGDLRDLPIQPAGESGFRSTWDRRPADGTVTPEFLSIWMGDVPPGRYLLRVVADVPDAGAPLTAEQAIDRR